MRSLSKFTRPNVVISKCLCGARCRWDGERLDYPFVRALRRYARIVPVCPEIEIGLGVPRDRIILTKRGHGVALYQHSTRRQLAQKMNSFSRRFLADHTELDGFILKHRSPSCGVRRVKLYDSTWPDAVFTRSGTGLFAAHVLDHCPRLAITDEDRLKRERPREHWLTRLFTLAAFRAVRKSHSFERLRAFHTQHRLLLQTHHHRLTRDLDTALTPSGGEANACATIEQYESVLARILAAPPRRKSALKPFELALDVYSPHLKSSEVKRFERQLEDYRSGQRPLSDVRQTVQIWAVRYDKRFTRRDAVFRPYPGPLADA